jgi:hypothetical protein
MRLRAQVVIFAAVLVSTVPRTNAAILFQDNFNAGTSAANYTQVSDPDDLVAGALGGQNIFNAAFNFVNLGDDSDVRSGTAAYFETENALTTFVTGLNLDGSTPVSIKYDMLLQPRSSGSTEYGFVGVGNGTLPFQNYLSAATNGTEHSHGVFAGGLTDSDTAGSGDYVILESAGLVGEPGQLFNADAALNAQDGTSFATILPGGPGTPRWNSRVLGNHWTEVELLISGNQVTYKLDGFAVATVTSSVSPVGLVGFGIADPFPSRNQGRLVPPRAATAMLIDNVVISSIPEPASIFLTVIGSFVLLAASRRTTECRV